MPKPLERGDIVRVGMSDRLGVVVGPVQVEGRVHYLTIQFTPNPAAGMGCDMHLSRLARRSHRKVKDLRVGEFTCLEFIYSMREAMGLSKYPEELSCTKSASATTGG